MVGKCCFALGDFSTRFTWSKWRSPQKTSSLAQSCHSERSEESPGKDTDLWWSLRCKWSFPAESEVCLWQVKFHQRWSYGGKSIYFFVVHYSYRRLGDLSTSLEMTVFFLVVISTKRSAWRNPLRRSSTLLRVDTRVDINHLSDFRYTLKRSICAIALDMPWRAWWWESVIIFLFYTIITACRVYHQSLMTVYHQR